MKIMVDAEDVFEGIGEKWSAEFVRSHIDDAIKAEIRAAVKGALDKVWDRGVLQSQLEDFAAGVDMVVEEYLGGRLAALKGKTDVGKAP